MDDLEYGSGNSVARGSLDRVACRLSKRPFGGV
mgnify:CR=1 FL=1